MRLVLLLSLLFNVSTAFSDDMLWLDCMVSTASRCNFPQSLVFGPLVSSEQSEESGRVSESATQAIVLARHESSMVANKGTDSGGIPNGGSVVGSITEITPTVTYTFPGTAGHNGVISVSGNVTNGGAYFDVYNPDGTYLGGDTSYEYITLSQTGTYTVIVKSRYGGGTGSFEVYLALAPGANEHGSIINGGSRSESIDAYGEVDSLTFQGVAGQSGVISISGDVGGGGAYFGVYNPDGSFLEGGGSYEYITLSQTGTYTVIVTTNYGGGTGNFEVHLALAPGANEHGSIPNGGSISESIDADGEIDSFSFQGVAGQSGVISISGDVGGGGAYFGVYNPDGSFLGGGTSDDGITLSQTGIYTVIVTTNYGGGTGGYSITLDLASNGLSYAALGDSYSAGEGARPYRDPTDTWRDGCHRSTGAYSTKIRIPGTTQPISVRSDAEFDFFACTGAVVDNISASGEGQYGEPPQLAPVNRIDATRDLVTISVGGNDVYFARILAFCLAHEACNEITPFEPHSDLELGDLFPLLTTLVETRLLDLYPDIRDATPNAATVVVGYPLVVGGTECEAVRVPFVSEFALSESEQAWMREANGQLNDTIRKVTLLSGLHFVSMEQHFDGHEVCGRYDDWIFGLRPRDPKASFHPTVRGQAEMGKAINDHLALVSVAWPFGYLPSGLPRNPPPIVPGTQAKAPGPGPLPEFGPLEVTLSSAPAACDTAGNILIPGEPVSISGVGFAANETISISIKLTGEPAIALGTATADNAGTLQTSVVVPAGLSIGASGTIEALGAGSSGVGRLLLETIRIESALAVDSDQDGIPDACDNCPASSNADQLDSDGDGKGDVCDQCPLEFMDDEDRDGLCGGVDICPFDPDNDSDGDGLCANEDNCATLSNPGQSDVDGDGIGDACQSLGCFGTEISVSPKGSGDVTVTAPNCGLAKYFDNTPFSAVAEAREGQVFTGWTGDIVSTDNPLSVPVTSSLTLQANFRESEEEEIFNDSFEDQ